MATRRLFPRPHLGCTVTRFARTLALMSLRSRLQSLDGKSYGAYKSLAGRHELDDFTLYIDRVQSDPYAPPSSIRVFAPFDLRTDSDIAAADLLVRRAARLLPRGSKSDGQLLIDAPGQQVLERTSVWFHDDDTVEFRLEAALPAGGRRIRGRAAAKLLTETLPDVIAETIAVDPAELHDAAELHVDQQSLRTQVSDSGLIGFIADGSVLPRRSGDSDEPLWDAVPFAAPDTMRHTFTLPSGHEVTGMGLPAGITVIVGGGFHGKSTLLRALQFGVYDHIAGDGREYAVTTRDAVTLRAEDGRAVRGVDISPFIGELPSGSSTESFSTANASGSTSQAAWLIEALEAKSSALLIDEDTSATNFMIRDDRMRKIVPDDREPITPLLHRISGLWQSLGVSTVVVTGGTSAFLDVADHVILMDSYLPQDATAQARELAEPAPQVRPFELPEPRHFKADVSGRKPPQAKSRTHIKVGHDTLDLWALSQLVDDSQTRALATLLPEVARRLESGDDLYTACTIAMEDWPTGRASRSGRLARPRLQELLFAVNHLR